MEKKDREKHWNNFSMVYKRVRPQNSFRTMKDDKLVIYVKENPKNKDAQDEFYYRRLWDTADGRKLIGDIY